MPDTKPFAQACLGAPQMQGRTCRSLKPITVPKGLTMQKIMDLFRQTPSMASLMDKNTHFVSGSGYDVGQLTEMYTNVLMDDCESSTLLAKLMRKTWENLYSSHAEVGNRLASDAAVCDRLAKRLISECASWPIFRNFTDKSWAGMARIIERGGRMLQAGHLKIMSTVGLASTASAGDAGGGCESLNGHCFNVGWLQTPSMESPECMILEGTAETIFLNQTPDSPKMIVKLRTPSENGVACVSNTLPFDQFVSLFTGTAEYLLRVINRPNGGMSDLTAGWPFPQPVTGWVGRTMVMPGLRSTTPCVSQFYNRVLYTGWACTDQGVGCMPVEEVGTVTTGCPPRALNNPNIRGISADIKPDELKIIAAVMEETTPPMVDPAVFKHLSSYWVPCQPLENVNQQTKSRQSMPHVRVAVTETPGVPEFIPLLFEAKTRAVEKANAINAQRQDSDGIYAVACQEGTGVHVLFDIPLKSGALTYIESLRQALQEVGWPGTVISVPGGIHH